MARNPLFPAVLMVATVLPTAPGQTGEWSSVELQEAIQGFLEDSLQLQLAVSGELLQHQAEAYASICAWIHGDHREYLLRVERLLDSLSDDRWSVRENAERTLIETGGNARALLAVRVQDESRPLEERIRSRRILERIDAIGTDKEQRETELLRGLVDTALYLESEPRLLRALHSALRHTDPMVVEGATRAIGALGGDDDADAVAQMIEWKSRQYRGIALAALSRLEGPRALALSLELLADGEMTPAESTTVLRGLRQRGDADAVMESLATHPDPLIAKVTSRVLPDEVGMVQTVRLTLADRTTLTKPFLGFTGDSIVIGDPAPGLSRAEVPFAECDVLDFADVAAPRDGGTDRIFLTQGSLVTGRLAGLDENEVVVDTLVFGTVHLPRKNIQGLALDPDLDRLVGASSTHDRVRLKDGSFLDGVVQRIKGEDLIIANLDGGQTVTPRSEVAGILLRRPIQPEHDRNIYYRVDLGSGDRLLAYVAGATSSHLTLFTPLLGEAVVPITDITRIELGVGGGALWGFTLIADYSDNRLVEVDDQGRVVFEISEVFGAWDVECLDSSNLLITEFSVSRVQEITREGEVVWLFEDLKNPYDADRLPNGNTLIADTFGGRVIEVDREGTIVWQYNEEIRPFDTDRLLNGNTLIADVLKDRVLEVDRDGQIVWQVDNLPNIHDADRLPNGNTLITLRTVNKVVEIDRDGKQVFEIVNLNSPSDADRLPNGHTLVAENGMVREFDRRGNVVWQKEMTWAVEVNRY